MKNTIKKILLGNTQEQEYICTPYEKLTDPFKVILSCDEKNISVDVTSSHLFLGYKPLVIGIFSNYEDAFYHPLQSGKEIILAFKQIVGTHDKTIAFLRLKVLTRKNFKAGSLFILEGMFGEHSFLSPFHQFTNTIYENLKKKPQGNIDLHGNLHSQVAIAYSLPRIISVITVKKNNLINLFPTDLHGRIDDEHYVSSLRHAGKVCRQVEEIKKIVLSNVSSDFYKQAYAMGKNHMQEMKPESDFNTSLKSALLNFPIVNETLSYKEMEVTDHFDVSIHRIFFYKIFNEKTVSTNAYTLSHLHQYYMHWRQRKGLSIEKLLR